MKKYLLLLLALIALYQTGNGQTTIADNETVSGNWTLDNSPYLLEGRAIIPENETLVIEPGVEVRLKSSAGSSISVFEYTSGNVGVLRVQGSLIANGTEALPILFTRNTTGFWGAILIDENANSNSSMEHCIIEYARETRNVSGITSVVSFNGGLNVFRSSMNIANNQFRNNNTNGLSIREAGTSFDFSNNSFFENGSNGVTIVESTVNGINNSFYNNSFITSGSVSAIRSSNSTVFLFGNLIYNNDDFGIYTTTGGNHILVNNTIYGNRQGIRVETGANTFIYNSIIQNNELNFATSAPGGATIEMSHSLTDDSSFPANVTDLSNNLIGSSAQFLNVETDDFGLEETSPCIDSGTENITDFTFPEVDILGNPRIDNNTVDMGAIEFQGSLGASDFTTAQQLILSPNPARDHLTISLPNFKSASLYSSNGKLIKVIQSNIVDVSDVEQGVYILRTETLDGKSISKKIIKK
jgi:parallel beta-helix repeat protein